MEEQNGQEGEKARKLVFREDDCRPGVDRGVWDGGPFTVVRYQYAPGSIFPAHDHASSQITVVLSGRIEFEVEGNSIALGPGESVFIPGGASHSARVPDHGDAVVSINIFHPPRKEHP